jgi:DNA-binding MarR family transcriptional regulator
MDLGQIERVRRFNRAVTARLGVLGDDYLGRGRPWGESRLLFEIGRGGAEVRMLRARLGLDSGYLSRLLRSLEAKGLVTCRPSPDDARVRRAALTRKGLREWQALDDQSRAAASRQMAPLGAAQRERLLAAMGEVERWLRSGAVEIAPADPAGRDARACIDAYLDELRQRFDGGFDPARSPSAEPAELVPPAGLFLLARLDGEPVGCGALKAGGDGIGEIKRMWVASSARGLGVALRLLDALEAQAAAWRRQALRLDTNRALVEARALYLRNGYREIAAYNDNPYADHWFEKRLAGAARDG